MAPSRRETRSRTGSPYSGRPEQNSRASSRSAVAPATPRGKQAQQEPSSRHRYGLRSMLSNLIWGSPVKAVEEEQEHSEDGEEVDDSDADEEDAVYSQQAAIQVISDDEDEPRQQESAASSASSAPRRFTAAEKGKGSPKRTDSYSAARYLPQQPAFGSGLRSSTTFGDMQSLQRSVGLDNNIPTSTPNTSISQQEESLPSPGDVNSQLANFFAAKGTASLTADERKKISEILLGGNTPAESANSSVPTALTPNFSFNVPVPSSVKANTSILSPAYKGLARSSTTSGGLSSLASRPTGGLTGSHSMSSLASLANGTSGGAATANPRSALNRRQARPLYLGAGYSSQAIARRKRVQAQMGSLYSNLNSFDSTTAPSAGPPVTATPGKRRRVGEGAGSSMNIGTGSPASSSFDAANAPPAFSVEIPVPLTSTPASSRHSQQASLFNSAPHLKAQFASTPARPSPLRAAAVATPSPPPKSTEASPPRTMSKTAGLMRGIVGDNAEPSKKAKSATQASSTRSASAAPPSITMTRTSRPTARVPREELIKRAEPPSAAEILERSMPPELRPTANGKQARPKPPPVPGSARKTRASVAAEADAEKGDNGKSKEQSKENLRVPATRRSKSKSKTPEVQPQSSNSIAEPTKSTPVALSAGQVTPAQSEGMQVDESKSTETGSTSTKSAFSFGSGNPATPAPSFFGKGASKAPAPAAEEKEKEKSVPPKPMFAFNPPSQPSLPPAAPTSSAEKSSKSQEVRASSTVTKYSMDVDQSPSAPSQQAKDPKDEALQKASVSLPVFSLYETSFSFSASTGTDDDAAIKAVKQTVLEMPRNELISFELL